MTHANLLMENEDTKKSAINMYSSGIFGRMRKILHENGLGFLIRKSFVFAWRYIYGLLFLRFRTECHFTFRNESYLYFYHPYNFTWDNERAVEIPIAMKSIAANKGKNVLEMGNVLSHYFPLEWDVLDKFDDGDGIICKDIVDYNPSEKYDLIVSISTLEHVGFDDDVKDPGKIVETMKNLKECCLKPDGSMIFTMPLGYNPFMDKMLFDGVLGFDDISFMKRISKTEWREMSRNELGDYSYASEYIEAGAIVMGIYNGSK
ncbi:SAM-dependent methyltransferase [Candidatus Latescibacterota bacterium]